MTHLFNSGPDGACPQLATLASGRPHPDLQKECCTSRKVHRAEYDDVIKDIESYAQKLGQS
jgi:hypothetical protein